LLVNSSASDRSGANPAANGLTAATVGKLKKLWSFGTLSFETSSPAVQGGVVYIGRRTGRAMSSR
jgi:hypothetical protein